MNGGDGQLTHEVALQICATIDSDPVRSAEDKARAKAGVMALVGNEGPQLPSTAEGLRTAFARRGIQIASAEGDKIADAINQVLLEHGVTFAKTN